MNNKLKLRIADVFRSLAPCFFVIFYVPTLLLLGPQGAPGQRLCVPSASNLTHADLSLTLLGAPVSKATLRVMMIVLFIVRVRSRAPKREVESARARGRARDLLRKRDPRMTCSSERRRTGFKFNFKAWSFSKPLWPLGGEEELTRSFFSV